MTKQISPREWEALSAYLDKQLSPRELSRLETRLDSTPELRSALEDLRRTRAVLRSQPRLRAPRNFTLTPEMVGVRHQAAPARLYPGFRLASALASILLVLVVIGDLFTGVPVGTTQNISLSAAEMASDATSPPVFDDGARTFEAEPGILGAQEATPKTGEGTFDEPEDAEGFGVLEQETPAQEIQIPEAPEAAGGEQEEDVQSLEAPVEEDLADGTLLMPPAEAAPVQGREAAPIPAPVTQNTLRVIEIVLAAVALLAGAITFYLRRTRS